MSDEDPVEVTEEILPEPERRARTLSSRRASDNLADAPWPVRAVLVLGASTAIAMYLVWVLAEDVRGSQREQGNILQQHMQTTGAIGASIQNMENDHRDSSRTIQRILRQMCRQQAKTRADVDSCDPE